MNNLKKVLALVVAVAMFASFGFVASAADYSDVASSANYADAVNLLSNLGIINGYEDGTFRPDNTITRAEVAAIMVRMLGLEDSAEQGATIFTDVAADNWASGYVNVAQAQGIINGMGDGTFAPSAEVTYEQVVKMIVCALGYEPAATANGGYPTGYLYQASRIGVTKGIAGTTGSAASRATVARLVYNALEIELMDQTSFSTGLYGSIYDVQKGKTVLTEYLDLEKVDAVVVNTYLSDSGYEDGNNKVGLVITKNYKEDYDYAGIIEYDASTSTQSFVAEGTDAATLLGYTVIAYVGENDNGDDAIFAIAEKSGKNSTTVIDVADISKTEGELDFDLGTSTPIFDEDGIEIGTRLTGGAISYYKSSTAKNATEVTIDSTIYTKGVGTSDISDKNVVINGFNNSDYLNGQNDVVTLAANEEIDDITFLDNDNDGDFEFIFVNVYTDDAEEFVVDSVDLEDYYIEGVDNTGSIELDLDDPDYLYTVIKDGKIADFADIAEGDVVTVLDNSNSVKVKTLYVSSAVVEGTVDEVGEDGDEFTIAGKTYKASPYAVANGAIDKADDGVNADISAGDEGVYYINYLGKIAYVDAVSTIAGADYVYIIDADVSEGDFGDTSYIVKVVTAKGTVEVLTVKSKKVKVHYDKDENGVDVVDDELTDKEVYERYLDKYVGGLGTEDTDRSETAIAKINTNSAGEITEFYFPGAKNFKSKDTYINDADNEAKEFSEKKMTYGTIPVESNTVVFNIDTGERKTDGTIDYEEAVTATTLSNIFSDGTSYSFMAYGDDNFDEAKAIVTWDAKTAFDPEAPVMVVTAKKTVVSDEDTTYRLTGIMGGSEVSVIVDPDETSSADDIVKGNVIIFSKSTAGFAQNISVLYDSDKTGLGTDVFGVVKGGVDKIVTGAVEEKGTVVAHFGEITDKTNTRFQLNNNERIDYTPSDDGCNYIVVEKAANDITVKAGSYSSIKKSTGSSTYYAFVKSTADNYDEVTDVVVYKGF